MMRYFGAEVDSFSLFLFSVYVRATFSENDALFWS
jgi:hypothetical protein